MDPFDYVWTLYIWMDKERFVSPTKDTGSAGEHGRSCTFLHNGLQEWILAGPHGPRVTTVHHVHVR